MARFDPHNRTDYWWARDVPGLSLLRAELTTHDFPPHRHDALVVVVTELGGCGGLASRGMVEEVRPSELLVFNPTEPHASRMGRSRRWRYRSFYLTQSALDTVARELGVAALPYFTRNAVTDPTLIAGFGALHRAIECAEDRFHARELLVRAFGALFERYGSAARRRNVMPRDHTRLERTLALMRDGHAENLQLEDLAGAAGLTAFQLIGLFKRTVGMTPHAYLTQLRLAAACRQLRRGTPLAAAATVAGFYDQSAMTKHFKRCYGITPLQFARAARGGPAVVTPSISANTARSLGR